MVDSIFGIRRSLMEKRENLPYFLSFFPRVLEIAQPDKTRRDATGGLPHFIQHLSNIR